MIKPCFRFCFVSIWSPIHTKIVHWIAYGPWGKKVHQFFISVFKKLYGIEWADTSSFETLGDFFLRSILILPAGEPLVSPAEGRVIDGPHLFQKMTADQLNKEAVEVKGLVYQWKDFKEIDIQKFQNGCYWNFYLAPKNYHWVHAASAGTQLEAFRHSGKLWPVNALGRFLSENLYTENERLTFRWQTENFGEVVMICIGAMAVSGLYSEKGEVPYNQWKILSPYVQKAERLLAFKLGSSVLLLTQKTPSGLEKKSVVRVGDALCGSS
jgi:phosphatidylserine decarboxylase